MTPTSHFLKIYLNVILSITSGLLPVGFPIGTLCTVYPSPLPPPISETCPAHLILLDVRNKNIGKVKSNVILEQAVKVQRGSSGITVLYCTVFMEAYLTRK